MKARVTIPQIILHLEISSTFCSSRAFQKSNRANLYSFACSTRQQTVEHEMCRVLQLSTSIIGYLTYYSIEEIRKAHRTQRVHVEKKITGKFTSTQPWIDITTRCDN